LLEFFGSEDFPVAQPIRNRGGFEKEERESVQRRRRMV